jgi:hypothetical protein
MRSELAQRDRCLLRAAIVSAVLPDQRTPGIGIATISLMKAHSLTINNYWRSVDSSSRGSVGVR